MSRPASAAWYRCQTSVLSLSDSSLNPSAYNCTTAASSTRSRRYLRCGGAAPGGAGAGTPKPNEQPPEPPAHAALPRIDMIAMILFTLPFLPSFWTYFATFNFALSTYVDTLEVLRDVRRPFQFALDSLFERLGRRRFAVDDEGHPWRRRKSSQPAQDFIDVRVRRHRVEPLDPGGDVDNLAQHLDLLRAIAKEPPSRAAGLKPDEHHRIASIGQRRREVMEHATAGRHPARRDHDGRLGRLHDLLGLFDCLGNGHSRRVERADVALPLITMIQIGIELVEALAVELQRARRHGAVDIHGQNRNSLLLLELLDPVDDFLGAADGERRNNQFASARHRVTDDLVELRVFVRSMHSIAVRRFDEKHIGDRHLRGIGQNWTSVPSEIAAEQNRLVADLKARVGRPEQMARVDEFDVDAGDHRDRSVVSDRLQLRERSCCIERR